MQVLQVLWRFKTSCLNTLRWLFCSLDIMAYPTRAKPSCVGDYIDVKRRT